MPSTPHLLSSAILGLSMGAGCGAQRTPASSTTTEAGPKLGPREEAACGDHEPGKRASADSVLSTVVDDVVEADEPLRITRGDTLPPGKALAVNLTFRSAATTRAVFAASEPIAWNVHSHPASGIVEHQKGTGATGAINFEPPSLGVYSIFFRNDGRAPVTIDISVSVAKLR